MFDKLSPFILVGIHQFLYKADIFSLAQISRPMSKSAWKTSVKYDGGNYKKFIRDCSRHRLTLQKMVIKNINDPLLWIPFWVRDMEFVNCGPVITRIEEIPLSLSCRKINIKECDNYDWKTKFIEVPPLNLLV